MKALLKKQLMEMGAFLYQSNKSGKRRSKVSIVLYLLLFLYAFGMIGLLMGLVAVSLCEPLVMMGLDWLYFALMGIVASTLGVIGSVFSTYTGLYQAKDNEFLLSLPLRPSRILMTRMLSCYVLTLFFELLVLIPADAVYAIVAAPQGMALLLQALLAVVLPLFALSISCILGWLIALIAARLQGQLKTIATVVLSLVFIGAYYYFYMQAYQYLQLLLVNSAQVGQIIKTVLYPLYQMGLASCGNVISCIIFTLLVGLLFAVIYAILSRSFYHLATTKRGGTKAVYHKRSMKMRSARAALVKKEFSRYTHSASYMLNCSLGTVFLLVGAVALIWQCDSLRTLIRELTAAEPMIKPMLPLIAAGLIAMIGGMNDLTAPSVSLEGKQIWIVQTLPLDPWNILRAKLSLHLWLTLLPVLIFAAALAYVIEVPLAIAGCILAVSGLYAWASAALGLVIGLLLPNLNWTNETVAVKQGLGVMLALLLNWVIVIGLGALYVILQKTVQADAYLVLCAVLLGLVGLGCMLWLKKQGVKRFAALSV